MTQPKPGWKPWGDHPVVVSILVITALIGTIVVIVQLLQRNYSVEYTGRVLDSQTLAAVRGAKVTLDFQGAPPIVYSDSEGVYRFVLILRTETVAGRVRVEAANYEPYDRHITLSPSVVQLEDIRLVATTSSIPTLPDATQVVPMPTAFAVVAEPTVQLTPTPSAAFPAVWSGEYFNNENLSGQSVLSRQNEALDFVWDGQSPGSGIPFENWSARWTTNQCFNGSTLSFYMNYDDGLRLSIDGNIVWDAWSGPAQEVWKDFSIPECSTIVVEYRQLTGGSRAKVGWFEPLATASAEELRLAGRSALVQENYHQAIFYFSRAFTLERGGAEDYIWRGVAYMNINAHDEAIVDFLEAIKIEPNNVNAYNFLGSVYINKKMYPQAITNFNKAIELKPQDANLYNSRGVAYMASSNFDNAVADFKKVLEISQDDVLREQVKKQLRELGVDEERLNTSPTPTKSSM